MMDVDESAAGDFDSAGEGDAAIEIDTAPNPQCAVIWLHGLGSDGHDFEPMAPVLAAAVGVPMRLVFPHATMRAVTLNDGAVMRAWYDVYAADFGAAPDAAGIAEAAAVVGALIARQHARGMAFDKIFLAGYSQGGAVVLHAGPRFGERLGGVIALSTYLPLADSLAAEKSDANHALPIFMAHGVDDDVIPLALGQRGAQQLTAAGYALRWREYPMAHSVSADEVADVAAFLRELLVGGDGG